MAHDETPGVVVGVDGSDPARRALDWAMTEAELRGLPLYVVAAGPVATTYAAAVTGTVYGQELDAAADRLREAAEIIVSRVQEERGRAFTGELRIQAYSGSPTEVLLDLSERHELLVVGSRGSGGFSRLLLGSVSTAVVHHASCPVLVVRK